MGEGEDREEVSVEELRAESSAGRNFGRFTVGRPSSILCLTRETRYSGLHRPECDGERRRAGENNRDGGKRKETGSWKQRQTRRRVLLKGKEKRG